MFTFISSPISSRGKRYQPEAEDVDIVYDVSRHVGTDTGSDTDSSPQIEIFAKEAICRVLISTEI